MIMRVKVFIEKFRTSSFHSSGKEKGEKNMFIFPAASV